MGRLSATMLAELKRSAPRVAYLLDLGPIAGVTYRYSDKGYITDRMYEARVLSWGGISVGVDESENVLDFGSVALELDDSDQAITRLLEGPDRHAVRGAAAVIRLASPSVPSTDWLTLYSGRIETYGQPSPLRWSITLAPQSLPLLGTSVPADKITRATWPRAPLESIDKATPIIYGKHSSASGSNAGAVPAILVDQSGFRYLLAAGSLLAVDKVYADGISVAAAGYSVTTPTVNGRTYTLIDFTADQGDAVITADVRGYYVTGDEGPALISSPSMILWHFLTNWVYGTYRAGAWLDYSSMPIDVDGTFGAYVLFWSLRGSQGSLYVGTRRRGIDVLNDQLISHEAKAYWSLDGKVAYAIEDFTAWAYVTDAILREDEVNGLDVSYPVSGLVDSLTGKYGPSAVAGSYAQQLSVKDLSTGEGVPDDVDLPASPAFVL